MELPYSNLQLKHWNPNAEHPLILPVHVICNTSDEEIYENIRINSARDKVWQKVIPAHDRVAVICGSGPSLKDNLEKIKEKRDQGCVIFALNGAAKFLYENGVYPDYQVILDAREETAQLIGPAKEHLFASQVHPSLFEQVPDAVLWQLDVGKPELFDHYIPDFAIIGGAASVGNTTTCLAFAMGYRDLQLFGYDSSHRDGKGHAFSQPMNDGDPCASVHFNGKDYIASLTMKLQAEKFQETSRALIDAGCKIEVHGEGLLPDMFRAKTENLSEKEKYERMWSHSTYRKYSPGEDILHYFLDVADPQGRIIDFGCGTGRAAKKLSDFGYDVVLVDFASNSRDPEAQHLPFIEWDLTQPLIIQGEYGYCTDVMEHIPPEDVDTVINNIMNAAPNVFFQISTVPDNLGKLINQPLHLTVEPHKAWEERFNRLGYWVEWQKKDPVASMFYVIKK